MPARNGHDRARTPWLALRQPLGSRQRAMLTALSFLGPLGIWCAVSYLPFIWHPDVKLTLSADREGVTTVYIVGDHLSQAFFPTFAEAVRQENENLEAARLAGDAPPGVRRENLKTIRHLVPWGIANGFLSDSEARDDRAALGLWQMAAEGRAGSRVRLTDENRSIAQRNWEMLRPLAASATLRTHDLPEAPLLKLIPQGRPSNPVYLPAPHQVIRAGWRDFTATPASGGPAMTERLLHSMRIVFGGFLLAAAVGVPLAILCGSFDFFSRLFEPFIDFFRYLPAPAFSTLLVAIFMAHDAPKIALVFVGTFFQLVLVVANTARRVDVALVEAARTLGAKSRDVLLRVIVPGMLPQLYNDLRILLGWAWTWLVIAELIGVKSGLTEFIETQGRWRNFDRVFPVIFCIGAIGFLTDQTLSWLRVYFFRWTGEAPNAFSRLVASSVSAGPRWFQREVLDQRLDPIAERRNRK